MPFLIVRHDITKMKVDAIVNPANTFLQRGGGVCGAIFAAAGPEQLEAACAPLAPIAFGEAVITPGFNLPAKYIIHAAGPVYDDRNPGASATLLRSAYINSLRLAVDSGCRSVAFPLISSGLYGFPKEKALTTARTAIRDFLADADPDMEVFLVVFDNESFAVSRRLLGNVASYIDEHYAGKYSPTYAYVSESDRLLLREAGAVRRPFVRRPFARRPLPVRPDADLDEWVRNLDEPFSVWLFRLIDAKGMTDVEVYKRANLDRKLFSKIRNNPDYTPSKRTAIALALALELSLEETEDLLARAGYTLSPSHMFDVIVQYFIVNGEYDIFTINEVLFEYDQPLLGS